ncbi:sugar ABC transporter permease [Halobacteriales archaeon SW_12_69_24]|nr:MAG: sugar ABC transporter permease [Halobacteriales archaeon SW_12_69_24]
MASREVFESRLGAAALLVPTVLVSLCFLYLPAARALELSFYEVSFGGTSGFTGLGNFRVLLGSGDYHASVLVSVLFTVVVVATVMAVSLYLTFLIHEVEVGQSLYLVSAIWPYALPPAVAGLVFLFLAHPTLGVFTRPIEALGVEVDWFSDGGQALVVVTVAAVWKQIGYNVIFMISSMNDVPKSLTETASLDGVGRLSRLLRVYVPIMSPTLFFLVIMNTIYAFFGTFALVEVMTKGGPSGATNILIFDLYRTAFQFYEFGLASAKSVVLFAVVGVLMYVQFRLTEEYAHYGG